MPYIFNNKEYEEWLIYYHSHKLAAPIDISIEDNIVYFGAVDGATSYKLIVDGNLFAEVSITGSGKSSWILNDDITFNEEDITENINFTINDEDDYTQLTVKDTHGSDSIASILFNSTPAYYEGLNGWVIEGYRRIAFSGTPSTVLSRFLKENAIPKPETLQVDLTEQDAWNTISTGTHSLQLIAKGPHLLESNLSAAYPFGKDVSYLKGVLYGPYTVIRAVDGDTAVANIDGVETKFRMIGVNTPESVSTNHGTTINCPQGVIASNYVKNVLSAGTQVWIEFDNQQIDTFNRFLCYVYLDANKNRMLNKELIDIGYGEAKYYSPNGEYRSVFDNAQDIAERNGEGFWGDGFFPTKLRAPVLSISGSIISWNRDANAGDFELRVKKGSSIVQRITIPQPTGSSTNQYDILNIGLTESGLYSFYMVANPAVGTHTTSGVSNTVQYTI